MVTVSCDHIPVLRSQGQDNPLDLARQLSLVSEFQDSVKPCPEIK